MLKIKSPYDMHLHLRDKEMLESVAKFSAKYFSGGVVMPNLAQPISSVDLALAYKQRILAACGDDNFTPFMTLYLNENLDKKELQRAVENDIRILKLYPKGATTNSENGVSDVLSPKMLEILEIAQELGFFLSIHGESGGFSLDREVEFHPIFSELAQTFPKLKIIFEHLSDRRSIALVEKYENLFATLSLHHISMSLDDVIGGALNPHNFCKPILKLPQDRDALLSVALSAHSKFAFGSDSAPHLKSAKETAKGAAGIFSAPILLPALIEIFEKHNKLENLEKFVSLNAQKIYNLKGDSKEIVLVKKEMKIPELIDGICPLRAGEILSWSYAENV
ncbi:MAG: dihydroorotase [Helicobacter sp.]|nr:dihydroorotase [Helicobacteraceae bacterium]MDY3114324.1 dihydroorotase [Helicobacter sp.]